ncbi:nickel transporter [Actinomadura bangladeshensis]|uniref:Nickel transporter n=1 Tax=Actinomadura bangladeshensis TaxID=453573 RepID=A0A6L9QMV2_9ACTN|nr:nickel transporter [Actinomadura bangladeshensis]NEA26725.1 nickel transporter [Actinomadura bangladeshensis]
MIAAVIAAGLLAAHPLGNFTVNHYDGLVAAPHELRIDHVEDLAEIPAAQAMPDVDSDGDGRPSATELSRWAAGSCARAASSMRIAVDGRAAAASVRSASASAPRGQAGLPTLRLECRITAPAGPGTVSFRTGGAADGRIGWWEITARGDRTTLAASDVPESSRSRRLTAYPADMLASPLDRRSATFTTRPGGPPLADSASGGPELLLPRGADGLTQRFTSLVAAHDLTPGFAALAFLIALLLGALHALAPGHGKTIMAAHAIGDGRRRTRDVLTLGLTVTLTHTAGVLTLGLLVTTGSLLAPETLLPWLGAAGGVLVTAAGALLLRRALRNRRHAHTHGHGHRHRETRRGGVVLMGLAGGMVPSPSAVVVLVGGAAIGRAWFGVVLVLAYGLGLAAALVAVGLLVVGSGRALMRRIPATRLRLPHGMMPVGTSATVVVLGLGLTLRSLVP